MKTLLISALALVASTHAVACDKNSDASTTSATSADNTKANARDRDAAAVTAMDQSNNSADLTTTQAIRKALMADDALSSDAKNVKIITANGTVTLRGPVKTAAEKMNIESKAKAAAGSNRVDNQIDVEAK